MQEKERALDGVKVLDFTTMMSGPYCTRLMADLGADVVKVEAPGGDYIRMRVPLREGKSTYFATLNCGKKSIVLDLKQKEALETVKQLAAQCDVLVENFRPGVMQRLGLDYETLSALNPRLVYCSISGFGQNGPWAQRSAYAPVLHAACGYDLANADYQDGLERPLKTGIFVADVLGGSLAFGGIQAALVRAARTGRGDYVDLSLMDSMLGMLIYECQAAQFPTDHKRPLYQATRAKDGFILIATVNQNNFEALAQGTGHPEWLQDQRFSNASRGPNLGSHREHHWSELMALLDEWAAPYTAAECEAILNKAGVPCSRYLSVREAMDHPAIQARGSFATLDDGAGPFRVPNPAFQFRNTVAQARDSVPELGADTASVLNDWLGWSPDQVQNLQTATA
ncbi:CaiB/BaiF CoA-transferase family protein [Hydrogenophaga sp.]|uniref:CaiB/BaiF CoA transferase family protein n=1 Tax=Hydrogenophaga sp. TaxID=1904254 RepID=UPI0027271846|nr:CoA transferase [Hydrogenophaga sp.]MDO9439054.1 CoA transferase [Hydrogenophaga sp.]